MTLSELLLLLTLLVAVGSLIISVVNTTFDIAWKVSHDRQNDDNKKANDRLLVPQPDTVTRFL